MTVEIITSQYELAHSHAPRGRGMWAFGTSQRWHDRAAVFWSEGNASYGEAKRAAIAWAKRHGYERLWVGS